MKVTFYGSIALGAIAAQSAKAALLDELEEKDFSLPQLEQEFDPELSSQMMAATEANSDVMAANESLGEDSDADWAEIESEFDDDSIDEQLDLAQSNDKLT